MTFFFLSFICNHKNICFKQCCDEKGAKELFFCHLLTFPKVGSSEHGCKWLQMELCREQYVIYLLTNENNVADQWMIGGKELCGDFYIVSLVDKRTLLGVNCLLVKATL
jgi:hypothetical protein